MGKEFNSEKNVRNKTPKKIETKRKTKMSFAAVRCADKANCGCCNEGKSGIAAGQRKAIEK